MDRKIEKKKWDAKKISLIGIALLLVFFFIAKVSGSGSDSRLKVKKDRLSFSTVKKGTFREYIPVTGNVEPFKTVFMDAEEGGRVNGIFVKNGDYVQKGDSILKLSNTSLELNFMNRESELLDQINNIRNSKIAMENQSLNLKDQSVELNYQILDQETQFRRLEKLYEKQMIPQAEYEESRNRLHYLQNKRVVLDEKMDTDKRLRTQQEAQLDSSMDLLLKNLAFISSSIENLIVRAPMSGQVSGLHVEEGVTINKGSNIGQVDELSSYKISVQVDEHYISKVYEGQIAHLELNQKKYILEIVRVYPEVNTGSFEVDMIFNGDSPEGIRRGQSLQIKLALSNETEAMLVSRGRFYQSTGGHWAYVLSKDKNTAYKKNIEIGRQNPSYYEVISGLDTGEEVIVSGYDNFNDADELILE